MISATLKNAIKANLDQLVTAGVLSGAAITDLRKDPLAADIPGFPFAFLMPPSIESEMSDNRSNMRTYTYDIMILWNALNLADDTTVEADIEAILDVFDNDVTLGGAAGAGVMPVASAPVAVQSAGGKSLIMAGIQIQARVLVDLSF